MLLYFFLQLEVSVKKVMTDTLKFYDGYSNTTTGVRLTWDKVMKDVN